ncbi:NlpC/P60 family protein [Rhodococcus opacus]|uniref:NlpC/P60 family protein n=1 Tax=Rhodococcus TaxID=1827 RepID=UPI00131F5866|nr:MULTISPECIES: NlpC/P60 family protein [Rhodococcus]MDX5961850.1 NlpC/P60 family protein [Rhodococcus opacus]QHE74364.1 hypothetical protein GFS60_08065 [Rhodococcus sp. WAY2]
MGQRCQPGLGRARSARLLFGFVLVGATVISLPGVAVGIPPPPPNPSDSDLQYANDQVGQRLEQVGDLINQVASANQRLEGIASQVAIKREEVNKALVDLQNARDEVEVATAAVGAARSNVVAATATIDQAQQQFDEFAAASYRQGTAGALTTLLGSSGPDDILARADLLRVIVDKRTAVMEDLQRARTTQANRDSSARAAKQAADAAAAAAEEKKSQAQDAIEQAVTAQQSATSQQAEIIKERNSAQAQLDAARSSVVGLQDQRQVYGQWDIQRQAEEAAAAAAATVAQQAASEAAARVAANRVAQERAAKIADGERPHTQVSDPPEDDIAADSETTASTDRAGRSTSDDPSGPADEGPDTGEETPTGSAAIETVIDRAMSQLGVRYSWGGGNAKGPTVGIRDGGVADSFGDYMNPGFDCSGLILYAFAGVGISLPHYSGYQYTAGAQFPTSQMKRGDLIFYGPNGSEHEALYLGNDQMLEAPESGDVVKVSPVRWSGMTPYVTRLL